MFITLRTSGGQKEADGMEQVARRTAGPDGARGRVRPTRRSACVACQTKKLRCTGSSRNCDRCRARLIECVFPRSNVPDNQRTTNLLQDRSSSRPACRRLGHGFSQPGDASPDSTLGDEGDGSSPGSSKPLQQPITPEPTALTGVDPLGGDLLDSEFTVINSVDGDWTTELMATAGVDVIDGPDIDISELGQGGTTAELRSGMSTADNGSGDAPRGNDSPSCSCLSDLVRVVQQLDDDEFHITSMSLDQALQLQKWLVFQCCKPLDCPRCLELPTIQTVRLIICDRLTEMFECIHVRIRRAGALLTGQSSDSNTPTSSSQSPNSNPTPPHDSIHPIRTPPAAAVGTGPLSAQLFCGSSGRAAGTAACNPLMFSDHFRDLYSDEEQVHMVRVLLRLQVRNFQKLLLRVEHTNPVAANQARQAKVKSMMERLSKAAANIEGALRVVFQALSIG